MEQALRARNYWIGVVSKSHVDKAVAGGFTQLNHGKAGPLERMREGWRPFRRSVNRLGLTALAETTASGWTYKAMLGHIDRSGNPASSWNAAHQSRGCSQPDLIATGGNGLFYCFAAQ